MIWILYGAFLCTRIRKKFTCTLSKLALLFVGLLSLRVACIVKIMGQFLSVGAKSYEHTFAWAQHWQATKSKQSMGSLDHERRVTPSP